jgi:hypothetical protein
MLVVERFLNAEVLAVIGRRRASRPAPGIAVE